MGDLVMADWVMVATELVMEVCNLLKLVSFYLLLEQNASNKKVTVLAAMVDTVDMVKQTFSRCRKYCIGIKKLV